MHIIKIQKLNYKYQKNNPVLTQINLTIKSGEITGLLGVNGAGKSTLISLLTGQLKAKNGLIEVFGKNYNLHRNEILRQIALVPQGYAFYPNLSVKENILFFAAIRNDLTHKNRRVQDAIEFCQLEDFANQLAKNLSGGLKRRLNLAIGIVNKPKLLFLDEPTVGIDPISQNFILKSIQRLKDKGVTIIYTSHQMHEIEKLCEQIIIINKGMISYQGGLQKLRRQQNYYFSAVSDKPIKMLEFCKKYKLTSVKNKIIGELENTVDIKKFTHEFNEQLNGRLSSFCIKSANMEDLFFKLIK